MEYDDNPAPGGGYLAFLHLTLGSVLLLEIVLLWKYTSGSTVALFSVGHSVLIVAVIYAGLLHAAYNTQYTARGGKLDIRCGIFKSSLKLNRVNNIEKQQQ